MRVRHLDTQNIYDKECGWRSSAVSTEASSGQSKTTEIDVVTIVTICLQKTELNNISAGMRGHFNRCRETSLPFADN